MPKSPYRLSKSRYTRGLQCHKSLWLIFHKPELREESDATQMVFQQGHEVGELAQDIFPGGVMIPFDGKSYDEQIDMTREAMKTATVIYEAAFRYDGVFVKADIMRKVARGWEIYEVKSSTKVKDVFLNDLAVQYYVIKGAGVSISKTFLTHLDTKYVRDGALDVKQLFVSTNVTEEIKELQAGVKKEIQQQKKVVAAAKEPKIDIGPHCDSPYPCDFSDYCWRKIPDNSVFDLTGKGVDKFKLYGEGIVKMKDIPRDRLKGKQLQQVEAFAHKKIIVNSPKLAKFLKEICYPLYFLDFETFMTAVPPYGGLRPFQQIPFQYSLHYQKRAGGKLYHTEFLAEPNCDPRKELLDSLLATIPENACVLVYNKTFEEGRLKELAQQFPRKAKRIKAIIDNMRDLLVPFRERGLYSWKQQGSHSIKAVLPAFVKGMSYEGMEVRDGGEAINAYHEMRAVADKPVELRKIRKTLLEYCCQDTLAMVKLLDVVKQKAG